MSQYLLWTCIIEVFALLAKTPIFFFQVIVPITLFLSVQYTSIKLHI